MAGRHCSSGLVVVIITWQLYNSGDRVGKKLGKRLVVLILIKFPHHSFSLEHSVKCNILHLLDKSGAIKKHGLFYSIIYVCNHIKTGLLWFSS